MYESSGPARKATLLKKLVLTRMQEGDDPKKHISEFFDAVRKLKELGLVVIDELLAILLLYSLPDSFTIFRTAMQSRDELPTTEVLKIKIIENHEGRRSVETGNNHGVMYANKLSARTKRSEKNERSEYGGQRNKSKIECYRCGRAGHIARECRTSLPSKPKESARQIEEKDNESDNESSSSKAITGATTMLSTTEEAMYGQENENEWCIDSGCSGHMCKARSMFVNFARVNTELNLANNESTKITGTGNVYLTVDTGKVERVVNFEKVFYVSDLRTNLLSVAKITDHGFEVRFRENDAVVIDRDNNVIVRADRIGNLYYVRCSRASANNAEQKTAEKRDIEQWHEKLGHLNERDLKTMAKNGAVYGLDLKDDEKLSECEI